MRRREPVNKSKTTTIIRQQLLAKHKIQAFLLTQSMKTAKRSWQTRIMRINRWDLKRFCFKTNPSQSCSSRGREVVYTTTATACLTISQWCRGLPPVTTTTLVFQRQFQLATHWITPLTAQRWAFLPSTTRPCRTLLNQRLSIFSKQQTRGKALTTTRNFSHSVSQFDRRALSYIFVCVINFSLEESGIWKLQVQAPFNAGCRDWVDQHASDWQLKAARKVLFPLPRLRRHHDWWAVRNN